jgi:hypothetical protein
MSVFCVRRKTDTTAKTNLSLALSLMMMMMNYALRLISGFRREVAENCALPGCYAASSGNFLPTFRDNISVPSSMVETTHPRTLEYSLVPL